MIKWILILLIVAAAASLLGMPALAGAAATSESGLTGSVAPPWLGEQPKTDAHRPRRLWRH